MRHKAKQRARLLLRSVCAFRREDASSQVDVRGGKTEEDREVRAIDRCEDYLLTYIHSFSPPGCELLLNKHLVCLFPTKETLEGVRSPEISEGRNNHITGTPEQQKPGFPVPSPAAPMDLALGRFPEKAGLQRSWA